MLAHASLPLRFWEDAFSTAVFLINRLPTPVLEGTSPLTKLHNKLPDYSVLRVFGCLCFPYLRPYNHHKLNFRTQPCTFLGYCENHKGYKCLTKEGRLYISRHVRFNETSFPFAPLPTALSQEPNSLPSPLYAPCLPHTTPSIILPSPSPQQVTNDSPSPLPSSSTHFVSSPLLPSS